jgi:hypothetical protein
MLCLSCYAYVFNKISHKGRTGPAWNWRGEGEKSREGGRVEKWPKQWLHMWINEQKCITKTCKTFLNQHLPGDLCVKQRERVGKHLGIESDKFGFREISSSEILCQKCSMEFCRHTGSDWYEKRWNKCNQSTLLRRDDFALGWTVCFR